MGAIQLADNVWWVGVKDPGLRTFDIYMQTKHGTTYNAYLVKGTQGVALIDTVKREFADEYFATIGSLVGFEQITHLIINHTEPDHSGAIAQLLEKNPNIKVICAPPAMPFVKATINQELPLTAVRDNETLELGGKKLVFKNTPYMHWPDTMMEYLEEDGILFSCDGFAAHIADKTLWADEVKADLQFEFKYYFDAIMRPFAGYIRRNLPKLDGLDIRMIATSHGPIFRKNCREVVQQYADWCVDRTEEANQVTIFFASNYGNTRKLAEVVSGELQRAGFTVALVDAEVAQADHIKDLIEISKAVLFATPTFNGDAVKPIWDAVSMISTVYSVGKKTAVFGSYGWGGEGVKLVADRLSGLKMKVFEEQFRARLIPSELELAEVTEFGKRVAAFVKG